MTSTPKAPETMEKNEGQPASSRSAAQEGSLEGDRPLSDAKKIAVVWAILLGISLAFVYCASSLLPRMALFSVQMDPSKNNRDGFHALGDKAFEAAERNFLESLQKDPRQHEPHFGLALVYRERDKLDEALQHIEQALALAPTEIQYLLARGGIYRDQRKFDMAIASVSDAIQISPDSDEVYQTMGFFLSEQKKWPEARKALYKALGLNTDNVQSERMLALSYMAEADYKEAIPSWEKLVAKQPGNAEFHFYLGLCLLESSETREAVKHLKTAAELEPGEYQAKMEHQLEKKGVSADGTRKENE